MTVSVPEDMSHPLHEFEMLLERNGQITQLAIDRLRITPPRREEYTVSSLVDGLLHGRSDVKAEPLCSLGGDSAVTHVMDCLSIREALHVSEPAWESPLKHFREELQRRKISEPELQEDRERALAHLATSIGWAMELERNETVRAEVDFSFEWVLDFGVAMKQEGGYPGMSDRELYEGFLRPLCALRELMYLDGDEGEKLGVFVAGMDELLEKYCHAYESPTPSTLTSAHSKSDIRRISGLQDLEERHLVLSLLGEAYS